MQAQIRIRYFEGVRKNHVLPQPNRLESNDDYDDNIQRKSGILCVCNACFFDQWDFVNILLLNLIASSMP
jgi:hypothetical protein